MARLSSDEVTARLKSLHNGWQQENSHLVREFKFDDFKSAFGFVAGITRLAENLNHHPDIELGWGRVKVSLTTHSDGGLSDRDFELASHIDDLHA